jgi:hypothetical protein
MRLLLIVSLFAACTTNNSHVTPANVHRTAPQACTHSPGDDFGADECLTDSDCGATGVCSCAGSTFEYAHQTRNICVAANCRVDSDCGAFTCSPSDGDSGPFYGAQGYYCHTADDSCGRDSDCVRGTQQGYCMYSQDVAHWVCGYNFAAG